MRRRDLLIATGAVASVIAAPRVAKYFDHEFQFDPIRGLPPFRRLSDWTTSTNRAAFTGIDRPNSAQMLLREKVRNRPCTSVFGNVAPDDQMPVAIFTDYYCPNCPEMSARLIAMADDLRVRLVWHDFPIFGARSERAARVAVAAGMQGQYEPVHTYLMQAGLRPGRQALDVLADNFNLNAERLAQDAQSAEVSGIIDHTRATAAVLGILGTPTSVVGRTVVAGVREKQFIKRLIVLERETASEPGHCRPLGNTAD